jgi:hypothetical protein
VLIVLVSYVSYSMVVSHACDCVVARLSCADSGRTSCAKGSAKR